MKEEKTMKKKLAVMVAGMMVCMTVMTGCGTDKTGDTGNTGKKSEEYLVGFANNSDTYNYCAKFRTYLKEMTEAKGIDITVTDAGGDTNVQNGQIDDFIVQNVNVVSAISLRKESLIVIKCQFFWEEICGICTTFPSQTCHDNPENRE